MEHLHFTIELVPVEKKKKELKTNPGLQYYVN